jgi:cytochrome P450
MSRDEEIFPDPNTFDPLRFYKIRQEKSQSAKPAETVAQTQFVSVNPTFLTWGYGKRACPGRFFASNVMKLFFAQFVMRYDIRMRPGHENDEHTLKENCLVRQIPHTVLILTTK